MISLSFAGVIAKEFRLFLLLGLSEVLSLSGWVRLVRRRGFFG